MKIDVLTLFPGMFRGPFEESMVRIARRRGCIDLRIHDLRDFADEPHRKVDDRPFGGGPGMVLSPEPVARAIEHILDDDALSRARGDSTATGSVMSCGPRLILTSPQGRRFDQAHARELSQTDHLVIVCGHYEGLDERVLDAFRFEEVSIGDYILTGGEIPAMALVDSVVRLIPGVLGDPESIANESFEGEWLDHPHYTRPRNFRGRSVPDILLSGDHEAIATWRRDRSIERTAARRQ